MSDHLGMSGVPERSPLVGVAVTAVSVAAITGVNYGLREVAPAVSTGVVYLLAVLLVSSYWGLWLGLLTGLLGAAAFNFFHLPPTGTFTLAEAENWVVLAVFFVAAAVTSALAEVARARADEAERRRREADLSAEMARLLLGGSNIEDAMPVVGQRVAAAFGLSSVAVALRWLESDQRRKAIPLVVDGDRIGTVLLPRDADAALLDALRGRVVPTLETLVAAAKRREELEAEVIETKALRRSDVVQKALLRSVSHDLRSPLTAITTAVRGLRSDTLSDEARDELTSVAATETARLSRLVENLLDLSRLQAGSAEPRSEWCSLEEIVRRPWTPCRRLPATSTSRWMGSCRRSAATPPSLSAPWRMYSTTRRVSPATTRWLCVLMLSADGWCCESATVVLGSLGRNSSASSSPSIGRASSHREVPGLG
jgi:two-component system sensor histidine kinase KdpD